MSTERPYHFDHLLQVLKKSLWSLILYIFLMFSCMYIAPGQEQTTSWWQSFDVNRKPRSLWPFVASFKMISWILILYTILNYFIHVYSPGARQTNLWGQNFDLNRKLLPLQPLVESLKKSLFEFLILHTFFNVFPHVYSPGAGADNPLGSEFLF